MYRNFQRPNYTNKPKWRPQNRRPSGFGAKIARETITRERYVSRTQATSQVAAPIAITHKFSDFALDPRILTNVTTRGYAIPTPIQDQAIEPIRAGRDVVGIANTGTGKTAAFLLPLIDKILQDHTQRVLIMAPTRELAVQIEDELRLFAKGLGITSVLLIGGASIDRQLFTLRSNPNIIIGTPGRLKDMIQHYRLNLASFQNIVLDEVDRMVDIGFIKDITYIVSLLPKVRQSLFFSATVTPEIRGIMQAFLTNPITISVKTHETAQGVEQDVIKVKDKEEKVAKLQLLLKQADYTKVLIFGRTKWNVEKLAKRLQQNGFTAASIHGNKSQNQRLRALTQFKQNQLQVLVATDIAARGLDISDVSHVINFDEPNSYTDYVHRIGRTGRANKSGKALTFVI
jgi:superfamily II DNA/RNA helicase